VTQVPSLYAIGIL